MDILSNYDYNKKFIAPYEFLTILMDIKKIFDYKIIQASFKYIINNKYIEDCYTSTIIYQFILSKRKNKTNMYNDLFFLESKNDQVYINYVVNNIDVFNNIIGKSVYSYPISIEYINII